MGETSLPMELELIWMSISAVTLMLAIIWTLVIFWPYLKKTKAIAIESLQLGKQSADHLATLQEKINPLVADTRETIDRINELVSEAREVGLSDLAKKLEEHISIIREGVERNTKPIPLRTRPEPSGTDGAPQLDPTRR